LPTQATRGTRNHAPLLARVLRHC